MYFLFHPKLQNTRHIRINWTFLQNCWNADCIHFRSGARIRSTSICIYDHSNYVHDSFLFSAKHATLSGEERRIRGKAQYPIRFTPSTSTISHLQKAEKALKFYKGCKGTTVAESTALTQELDRIKTVTNQRQADKKFHLIDFCKLNVKNYLIASAKNYNANELFQMNMMQ